MKAVIVGCGRVGALLAATLDQSGHDVSVIDVSTTAFDRLPSGFRGSAIRGNGTDEAVLRRAGTQDCDLFLALTEGDNRNVMSAQLAAEVFGARRSVAKINDPVRAQAYAELGVATVCRTNLIADAILGFAGLPGSGAPGIQTPTGHHGGGGPHLRRVGDVDADAAGAGAAAGTQDGVRSGAAGGGSGRDGTNHYGSAEHGAATAPIRGR